MSAFFNEWFNPAEPIGASNILATNGVSSLIDMVAFNVCDPGEGILVPTPTYSMFDHDLRARAGLSIVHVSTPHAEDQFRAGFSGKFVELLKTAYKEAARRGVRVKAILIANPSNPLGRFYSKETLRAIAAFCGEYRLHLIADEIYALSGFESTEQDKLPGFTSVLSLVNEQDRGIQIENIHSLYGASKDWGMGGLRLGFLVTRNSLFWKACRRLAYVFVSVPQ